MIYRIENGLLKEGEGSGEIVGLFPLSEMEAAVSKYGLDSRVCAEPVRNRYSKFLGFPDLDCLILNVPTTWQKELSMQRLVILLDRDKLFFFSENTALIREAVSPRLKDGGKTSRELLLRDYLDHLVGRDSLFLDQLEQGVLELENDLITSRRTNYVERIISFRRQLMVLKQYYEQFGDLLDDLMEDENQLLSGRNRRPFKLLAAKADRIFHTILNLRDYVTQVRESYQAQEDIRLNNIMKYFTVISTLFLPLTLIVGWYGMNVKMPEFQWKYGYLWVIGLCVAAVAACLAFFKKNKWF